MEFFFGKIQKSDLQEPPKFKQFVLPKFGSTASYHTGKYFFIKFCFYSQIQSTKINYNDGQPKILSEFEKIKQKLLKIAGILEALGGPIFEFFQKIFPQIYFIGHGMVVIVTFFESVRQPISLICTYIYYTYTLPGKTNRAFEKYLSWILLSWISRYRDIST